jgi:hypothetical protein
MTYREQHGGLWFVSHFSGEIGGSKFEGDGLDGYDPLKQKFVSIWADSLAPEVLITGGTWDKEKKQMTMTGKGIGQDGRTTRIRTVTTWNNDDDIDFAARPPAVAIPRWSNWVFGSLCVLACIPANELHSSPESIAEGRDSRVLASVREETITL